MMAHDNDTVRELNRLARANRVVAAEGLGLADGSVAGVGDVVVARHNDRHLRLSGGEWVGNRDRFLVTATHDDGSMAVRALDGGGHVVLPARTCPSTSSSATPLPSGPRREGPSAPPTPSSGCAWPERRCTWPPPGAGSPTACTWTSSPSRPTPTWPHGPTERLAAREVLVAIASRRGADVSAHETMASEWARATSFEQLVSEHQSLVAAATAARFEAVLRQGGGLPDDSLARARRSTECAGLLGAMRDAEDRGLDARAALCQLPGVPMSEGQDPASVLRARLQHWELATGGRWAPRQGLVAGLVPRAGGVDDEDLARAIHEREQAMERRARDLAEQAVRAGAPWSMPFGSPPANGVVAEVWWDRLVVIAAYRDRWRVTSTSILGDEAGIGSLREAAHRARARRAGQEAARLADLVPQPLVPTARAPTREIGPAVGL
jgi:hypothetical protein